MSWRSASCLPFISNAFLPPSTRRSATLWPATRMLWMRTRPTLTESRSAWRSCFVPCIKTAIIASVTSATCLTSTPARRSVRRMPPSSIWMTSRGSPIKVSRCSTSKKKNNSFLLQLVFVAGSRKGALAQCVHGLVLLLGNWEQGEEGVQVADVLIDCVRLSLALVFVISFSIPVFVNNSVPQYVFEWQVSLKSFPLRVARALDLILFH